MHLRPAVQPSNPVVRRIILTALLFVALWETGVHGQTPAAPSAVTATTIGVNAWDIQWTDNSTNEDFFAILYRIGTTGAFNQIGAAARAPASATGTLTTRVLLPNGFVSNTEFLNQSLQFIVVAVTQTPFTLSPDSNTATAAVTPAATTFGTPTLLTATATESTVTLNWQDNSNSEFVYEIQMDEGNTGTFTVLGQVVANVTTNVTVTGLTSATPHSFRVKALKETTSILETGYSNTANATTLPPNPPTGLLATRTNERDVSFMFTDNSGGEDGYQIDYRIVGSSTWIAAGTVGANVTATAPINWLDPMTDYEFQVRAFVGPSAAPTAYSAPSNTSAASTLFSAPTGVVVSATTSTSATITWFDNSAVEGAYGLYLREGGTGPFELIGFENANATSATITALSPETTYEFQVTAAYQSGAPTDRGILESSPSNTATATTPPLGAPTELIVTPSLPSEASFAFSWTDNSTGEAGFQVDYRVAGTTEWSKVTHYAPNTVVTTSIGGFDPATNYEFRVRAFTGPATTPTSFSTASNTASGTTSFNAPTQLTTTPVSHQSIRLNWVDNSSVEDFYAIYIRQGLSGSFELLDYAAPNATTYLVTNLSGATEYEFQVAAANQSNVPADRGILESERSNNAAGTTRDVLTSPVYTEGVVGQAFSYVATASSGSALISTNVSGLPSGLLFTDSPPTIGGTPSAAGVTECPVTLTFADGWVFNTTLTIRVLTPPTATATPLANQTLASTAPTVIDLSLAFDDPDVDSALTVSTSAGTMRLAMFDSVTPLTVANFMDYVNAGDFTNTLFHRSVPGFVVQGGGFKADPATGPAAFTQVPTRPPVQNEYSLSNVRGTVSMAKLGGNPNSATNQFFVSVDNNGPILNPQNGGFTVFGRVINADMAVADTINSGPIGDYAVTIDGTPTQFDDFPINAASAPPAMDNSLAVTIHSITPLPELTYSVHSNSNSAAVAATITSSSLSLQPLAPGTTTVVVRATDLDGNTSDQTLSITVPYSYADWTADENLLPGQNGPAQNPDFGSLPNLAEFVFMGDPLLPDDESFTPTPTTHTDSGSKRLAIQFNLRKNINLIVKVEANSSLSPTGWTTIWHNETDGLTAANVAAVTDQTTHHRLTVFDSSPPPTDTTRFLQVTISEKP